MSEFLKIFGELTLSSVVTFVVAIVFIAGGIVKLYKFVVKKHDLQQERTQALKDIQVKLVEITDSQRKMEETIATFTKKQEALEEGLAIISEQQTELSARQQEFEQTAKERNLSKLKNLLIQSYNYYYNENTNPLKMWSELEKENFYNLLQDYEAEGGNGYIHTNVVPDIATLTVVPMHDSDKINEMLKSRSK